MSRARSKTVDSTEVKKRGLPRGLNEKIALMREKEQAQSAAFEQAMKSILEMQQARIHSGGGSMPSLAAIDSPTGPYPPNVAIDSSSCLSTPSYHDRPNIGHTHTGERRTQSCERHAPPTNLMSPPYWNNLISDWNEGDISRHKSDSDLQQSLMESAHQQQQTYAPPVMMSSHVPTPSQLYHSFSSEFNPPSSVNPPAWTNGVASPKHTGSSVSAALLSPDYQPASNNDQLSSSLGGASSLPDLTNMEFSCGLDVPIERDDDSPTFPKPNMFHPSPGPSQLALSSMHATSRGESVAKQGGMAYTIDQPSSAITRSPTMPEFRSAPQQLSAPPVRKFKPIAPAIATCSAYSTPLYGHQGYSPLISQGMFFKLQDTPTVLASLPHHHTPHPAHSSTPASPKYQYCPPTTQPLTTPTALTTPMPSYTLPSVNIDKSMIMDTSVTTTTMDSPTKPPSLASNSSSGYVSLPSYVDPGQYYNAQRVAIQQKMAGINMNTPPIRSHSEENLMKLQKDMTKGEEMHQNPFMGSMSNANSVPCVHVQDPPSSLVQPCYDLDSPTTASPSTSASHASSPPYSRPNWLEHPHSMSEFMFHDWPLETANNADRQRPGSPLSHHKSLSDINKACAEFVNNAPPTSQNRSHQLSLPSIVMNDLIDDPVERPVLDHVDLDINFEMEDDMMQSLLTDDGFVGMLDIDPLNSSSDISREFLNHSLNF